MKKLAILLVISIILVSCEQSSSSDEESDDFDPSNISLINNCEDSAIPQSNSVFTRLSTGEGIIGTWNRYTEATRTYDGQTLTYRSYEKTDVFGPDGKYAVAVERNIPTPDGYDNSFQVTEGTYTLSIGEDGSYILTTTDKSGESVFTYLVSESFFLIQE